MFKVLMFFLNPYDRKARFQPVLFVLLPIFIVIILLVPDFDLIWTAIGGLVIFSGSCMLLTQLGRDRGKRLEPRLFHVWGGKPSVAMLRHCDTRLDGMTKDRYRSYLERAVPDLHLASLEQEQERPEEADEGYESATSWLLNKTRDIERYGLLFKENINYGIRRNVYSLKPWALVLDGTAMVLLLAFEFYSRTGDFMAALQAIHASIWISFVITVVHALVFIFFIKQDWVRVPAEAYARLLLAACDELDGE